MTHFEKLAKQYPLVFTKRIQIEDGWYDIFEELGVNITKALRDAPDTVFTLNWTKEKFGGLRIGYYIAGCSGRGHQAIHKAVEKAMVDSNHTCMFTGKPGTLRYDLSWVLCLCDEEYEKRKAIDKQREQQEGIVIRV